MSTQDQIGSISMNPLSVPTNRMPDDVRTFAAGDGVEHPLKVRKPYIITKQRERWAEEEHKKFLEALQLYGRAWRRIEEHIGTKTAVQIRSHAQKFFSKVVRESGTDGNVKSIEFPPPRPKRKPAHPYPRKLGNTCGNGGPSIGKLERSLSPMKSGFEQENGSPTSVLSGIGSDTLGSLLSNLPSRCASPVTSAAGSNEQEASIEEENNPQLTSQTTAMELDISSGYHSLLQKTSPVVEQVPYLKLFGKTVLVSDSNKPSSPPSPPPTLGFSGSQERSGNMVLGAPSQNFLQGICSGDFSLGVGKSNWSPWSGGVFPVFYPLPSFNFGNITSPADARIIPFPWWGVYGNLPSFSFAEPSSEKECSWTDSNNAPANEGGNVFSSQSGVKRRRNMETDDSPLLRSPRSRSDASVRGFVPYERCLVEKETQQYSHGVADDGEGQSVGLCL